MKPIQWTISTFTTIDSTNEYLKKLARDEAPEGTVIQATVQTSGRGRLDREWISPQGGLWFSLLIRPQIKIEKQAILTLMTAVALIRVLRKGYQINAEVKWPNDVLVENRKLAGVLTERVVTKQGSAIVIGIGINTNLELSQMPTDLRPNITSLRILTGNSCNNNLIRDRILKEVSSLYSSFSKGKEANLIQEWKSYTKLFGKQVRIKTPSKEYDGLAIDLDSTGALLIKLKTGNIQKVLAGDVRII